MDSIFNNDNFTKMHYNPSTGQENRLWIRYGDNTFEPVRRDGNLGLKYRSKSRPTDWWVTERPKDWNPAENGFDLSLNHDYGEQDKPGSRGVGGNEIDDKLFHRGEKVSAGDMSYKFGRDESKPVVFADKKTATAAPSGRKTTLAEGGDGYRRYEKERQAAKSSAQYAEDLKRWEREQGIDPNQGSGHERRPPSSSRDAAEMEHAQSKQPVKDYIKWLREQREHPAWGKEKTPVEKVRGVSDSITGSVLETVLEQELENRVSFPARTLGVGLEVLGPIADVLLSPKDAW
ncbi:hypothetical protein [Pseudodesulfovibrio sp.]|uniref:hypothetical protein n=1 Tax=unclassified Pseudodesulfovibrio TaxID=2661612 RepID=UPI003AFF6D85